MNSSKGLLVVSIAIAGLLLSCTSARADSILTITLSSPFQSGMDGDVLAFYATVANNTDSTMYLNGDNNSLDSPLILDDSPYNDNSNWYVLGPYDGPDSPGDSYTGLLFNVDIPAGTATGMYEGNFEIDGGSDDSADNDIGDAPFDVQVVPDEVYATPEPGSLLLLGTGLIGIAGSLRRLRR